MWATQYSHLPICACVRGSCMWPISSKWTAARGLGTSCMHDVGARMRGNWNVDGGIGARRDHALGWAFTSHWSCEVGWICASELHVDLFLDAASQWYQGGECSLYSIGKVGSTVEWRSISWDLGDYRGNGSQDSWGDLYFSDGCRVYFSDGCRQTVWLGEAHRVFALEFVYLGCCLSNLLHSVYYAFSVPLSKSCRWIDLFHLIFKYLFVARWKELLWGILPIFLLLHSIQKKVF